MTITTSQRVARRVTKKLFRVTSLALLISLAACGGSDDPNDEQGDGIFGTGIQINGTVSTQYALAPDSIEYKRQSGETGTQNLQSDGTFAAAEVQGSGAVLLRTTTDAGDSLYALALPDENAEINQNVHSYSDLVARNWFASTGQDINTVFNDAGALTAVPTQTELQSLEDTVSQIYSGVQSDYDFEGSNIFSDEYVANGLGIDGFLISNPVVINNGVINIYFVDPSTNIQSPATSTLNVNSNLLEGDTENPSTPDEIRALPAASDEILVVWNPAIDNVAIVGYDVYRDGALLDSTPYPVFVDETIIPGTEHSYFIVAVDSSGNQSAASESAIAQTVATPDTTAPTSPTNVLVESTDTGSIALSWMHSGDDVASFIVSRAQGAGALVEYLSVTSTSLTDFNILDGSEYCYQVTAVDGSGNPSMPSEVSCTGAGNPGTMTPVVNPMPETNNPVEMAIGTDDIYSLGSCGAEISAAPVSRDIDAPTVLLQGQVAGGQLSSTDTDHYWSFDVPQGDYVLVVEGFNSFDTRATNIILDVIELDSNGIETADLFTFNSVDNRVRELIPVTADDSGFHLKMEFSSIEQDYQVVLYSVDDILPSPFLADCPEIFVTSVGTTEAFSLETFEERYYLIDLPAGDYEVLINSALTDGSTTNIIYELSTYSLSNRASSEQEIVTLNEVDNFHRSLVEITSEAGGFLYLRWHSGLNEYDIDFTISAM